MVYSIPHAPRTMPHAPYPRIHAAAAGMTPWRHGPDQEAAIGGSSPDAASGHAAC